MYIYFNIKKEDKDAKNPTIIKNKINLCISNMQTLL